jgi:hypothetical protein
MSALKDLTGQRFNSLVVIERLENASSGKVRWRCECDCGSETVATTDNLKNGGVKSCGCLRKTPGKQSESPSHEAWSREVALFTEQFKADGLDVLPEGLLPKRSKGRQSTRGEALYNLQVSRFCDRLIQIRSHNGFRSR